MELVSPDGAHVGLLQDMCCKHAALIVDHVTSVLVSTLDTALMEAVLEMCQLMSHAVGFLPEMLADRCGDC